MKKHVIPILLLLLIITSCKYGTDNLFYSGNYVNKRTDNILELNEECTDDLPSAYSFAVITDVHYGSTKKDPPEIPEKEFLAWLSAFSAEERPAFCLVLGDVVETGGEDEYKDYKNFVAKIEAKGVKVFNAVGNHDLYNSGWDGWKKNCYPNTSFYTFKTSGFSFYCLDTGTESPGENQLMYLKTAMKNDSNPKIVFTHYPLVTDGFFFGMSNSTDRNLLLSMCAENNVKLYLSGHLHWYEEKDFVKFQTYTIPSFRYSGKWALVNVNNNTESYRLKIIDAE